MIKDKVREFEEMWARQHPFRSWEIQRKWLIKALTDIRTKTIEEVEKSIEGLGTKKGDTVNGNPDYMMGIDTALETLHSMKGKK